MEPIGTAIWGLRHQHPRWYRPLLAQLPQYRLVCVCEADTAVLADEAPRFGVEAVGEAARMLARRDVELVLVFVPHREMPEAVERAARAGKHVFVEKPMAADVEGARRVVAAAESARGKVTTGFYWRFNPLAGRIRRWIDEGLLGRIVHTEARFNGRLGDPAAYVRDGAPWMLDAEQGGSPVFNIGVHWIDLLWWLTGLETEAVQAVAVDLGGEPERTTTDLVDAGIEYAGGAVGMLSVGYNVPAAYPHGRDLWISIRGTMGCVDWAPSLGAEDDQALLVSEHPSMGEERVRRVRETKPQVEGYAGTMGLDMLTDFAEAIRRDRAVSIPVADGLRAAAVAEAVLGSARGEGRVTL